MSESWETDALSGESPRGRDKTGRLYFLKPTDNTGNTSAGTMGKSVSKQIWRNVARVSRVLSTECTVQKKKTHDLGYKKQLTEKGH